MILLVYFQMLYHLDLLLRLVLLLDYYFCIEGEEEGEERTTEMEIEFN